MTETVDYFSNHQLKLRFPWRLYHRPIVQELGNALGTCGGAEVLNVGSGPFFEFSELAGTRKHFTLCDIDPRAIQLATELHASQLRGADVITPNAPLPYASQTFDAVVSMDVVEHILDPLPWLREVLRVLKPGGLLFLTTPNYGSRSLRLLENTLLEAIARAQGFSRAGLHPTKLDAPKLEKLLEHAGASSTIRPIAFGWVLAAVCHHSSRSFHCK
jgi:SAM-dependent methyltransferase